MSQREKPKILHGRKTGLARATGTVAALTLVSRVLGLLRDIIVAVYFGAGFATDAFFVAFKIPNLLRRLVAEGSLATAFVPIFTDNLSKSDESGREAFGSIASFTLLLTLTLSILGIYFSPEIADFFAPGFAQDPDKRELAASLLRIMFPYVVLVSLLALSSSALNALGVFAGPAAAPALLNVALIISVLTMRDYFEQPIDSLAWAVLAGGVLALIPQLILLAKRGFALKFLSPFGSPAVKELLTLMLPSVISASVYQIMVFINTLLASLLSEGSVSWLYYADRIFQFPLGVFSIALATAVLPSFSRLVSEGKDEAFAHQLSHTLSWVSFITIPASVGMIVLAQPLVSSFYEHGLFDSGSSKNTASALWAYAVGLWSISVHTVLVRAFLAKKNTTLPAVVACVSISLNILLACALMGPAVVEPSTRFAELIVQAQQALAFFSLGHVGLALAGSLTTVLSAACLVLLLPRLGISLHFGVFSLALLRSLLASALMALSVSTVASMIDSSILTLVICVPLGALVYAAASFSLKSPELKETLTISSRFLRSRKVDDRALEA